MIRALLALAALAGSVAAPARVDPADPYRAHARNPLLPGYFADPTIIRDRGEWFVFATIDPWGGPTVGMWRSRNFRDWTFATPNWPTKAAATSPTSARA